MKCVHLGTHRSQLLGPCGYNKSVKVTVNSGCEGVLLKYFFSSTGHECWPGTIKACNPFICWGWCLILDLVQLHSRVLGKSLSLCVCVWKKRTFLQKINTGNEIALRLQCIHCRKWFWLEAANNDLHMRIVQYKIHFLAHRMK